jgi:hypothetical protein
MNISLEELLALMSFCFKDLRIKRGMLNEETLVIKNSRIPDICFYDTRELVVHTPSIKMQKIINIYLYDKRSFKKLRTFLNNE